MATYFIGDVQGCYDELQRLLDLIQYNPKSDRLGFVGDLINRGPQSLETLRFIKNLRNPIIVLGNHDFHLITLGSGLFENYKFHTLSPILEAKDKEELVDFLRKQPLAYLDSSQKYFVVHAGVPPQWSLEQALKHALEVQNVLQGKDYREFLFNLYGNEPNVWRKELGGYEKLRYITNALTRIRFCDSKGELDLENTASLSETPLLFKPWFEWRNKDTVDVIFGHWASLQGKCKKPGYFAIDTGCVWGNKLTAVRIEDKKLFSVNALRAYAP